MNARRRDRLQAGDRLPHLSLREVPGGREHRLRAYSRDALVLLLLPGAYALWRPYLDELTDAANRIEHWAARIRVVVAAEPGRAREAGREFEGRLTVLADPGEQACRAIGAEPTRATLVIADRYGQIYEVTSAGAPTDLPHPGEIVEWATYLATQCPECGVIDEPGHGEWAVG